MAAIAPIVLRKCGWAVQYVENVKVEIAEWIGCPRLAIHIVRELENVEGH